MSDANTSTKKVTFQIPQTVGDTVKALDKMIQDNVRPARRALLNPRVDMDLIGPSTEKPGCDHYTLELSMCNGPFKNIGEVHIDTSSWANPFKWIKFAADITDGVSDAIDKIMGDFCEGILMDFGHESEAKGLPAATVPTRSDIERLTLKLARHNGMVSFETEDYEYMLDDILSVHGRAKKEFDSFNGVMDKIMDKIDSEMGKSKRSKFGKKKNNPLKDMAEALMKDLEN